MNKLMIEGGDIAKMESCERREHVTLVRRRELLALATEIAGRIAEKAETRTELRMLMRMVDLLVD